MVPHNKNKPQILYSLFYKQLIRNQSDQYLILFFNSMRIKNCLKQVVRSFDLFSVSQFLRYNQEESYQTVSGGVTSIVVICIFLALFASTAIQTVNRSIIYWTSTSENYFEPSPTKISFGIQDKFMITVGIMGLDITDPTKRYFDIQLVETHGGAGGVVLETNTINLEPCTIEHFSITQKLKDNFANMNALKRLCPPLNYSYDLYGKFTSKEMQYLQVRVNKCNNALDPSRPCVNESVIDHLISVLGQFTIGLFYVNPLINPGSQSYLDYYFEDRNFLTFTKTLGAYSFARVQDYTIETDYSLLPLAETKVDNGVIIPDLFQVIPFEITNDNYASFYFMKSATKTTYQRSFNKVDQLFSYVGGLIGTILGFMLFMGNFTMMSFQLQMAQKLFKDKDGEKFDFQGFNIFTYLLFLLYKAGTRLGGFKSWQQMKKRATCKQEVLKQLDIGLFLQRFSFLERAVQSTIGPDHIDSTLYKLETIAQVKARRKKFALAQESNSESSQSSQKEDSGQNSAKQKERSQQEEIADHSLSQFHLKNTDLQYYQSSQLLKQPKPDIKRRKNNVVVNENEDLVRQPEKKERVNEFARSQTSRSSQYKKMKIEPQKAGEQDIKGSRKNIEFNDTLFFQHLEPLKTD